MKFEAIFADTLEEADGARMCLDKQCFSTVFSTPAVKHCDTPFENSVLKYKGTLYVKIPFHSIEKFHLFQSLVCEFVQVLTVLTGVKMRKTQQNS